MTESKSDVKVDDFDAIRVLQIIRGYFPHDENDPVMRFENLRYRRALDMAIEALKASGK